MEKKIKVLLVIPKLCNGGIERVASNFSMGLDSSKFEQYVFSIMPQNESYPFSVSVEVVNRDVKDNILGKFKNFLHRIKYLNEFIVNNEIDIIVSFGERCNIISMLTKASVKKIITIHSQLSIENNSKGKYGKFQGILSKLLYKRADEIVAVSETVKKDAIAYLGLNQNKFTVIYNGSDIGRIQNLALEPATLDYKDYIVSVGRITYAKGYPHLVRVVNELKKDIPSIKLIIIGGAERDGQLPIIEDLISFYGLQENILLLGQQENPFKYINNAKALVMSSIFEGFPGVVIESLACGTPIITTDCGGATEVISRGNSLNQPNNNLLVSDLGIVTPKITHVDNYKASLSHAEVKLGDAIKSLYIESKFDSKLIQKESEIYTTEKMVSHYEKLIYKVAGH